MYRILCDRTPARELGSGLTWFIEDGKIGLRPSGWRDFIEI
jgi:hypothetical protein